MSVWRSDPHWYDATADHRAHDNVRDAEGELVAGASNMDLCAMRAATVVASLVERGVAADRLEGRGAGSDARGGRTELAILQPAKTLVADSDAERLADRRAAKRERETAARLREGLPRHVCECGCHNEWEPPTLAPPPARAHACCQCALRREYSSLDDMPGVLYRSGPGLVEFEAHIEFVACSAMLAPASLVNERLLNAAYHLLVRYFFVELSVVGRVSGLLADGVYPWYDASGGLWYGRPEELALARAAAVKAVLVDNGVDPVRIHTSSGAPDGRRGSGRVELAPVVVPPSVADRACGCECHAAPQPAVWEAASGAGCCGCVGALFCVPEAASTPQLRIRGGVGTLTLPLIFMLGESALRMPSPSNAVGIRAVYDVLALYPRARVQILVSAVPEQSGVAVSRRHHKLASARARRVCKMLVSMGIDNDRVRGGCQQTVALRAPSSTSPLPNVVFDFGYDAAAPTRADQIVEPSVADDCVCGCHVQVEAEAVLPRGPVAWPEYPLADETVVRHGDAADVCGCEACSGPGVGAVEQSWVLGSVAMVRARRLPGHKQSRAPDVCRERVYDLATHTQSGVLGFGSRHGYTGEDNRYKPPLSTADEYFGLLEPGQRRSCAALMAPPAVEHGRRHVDDDDEVALVTRALSRSLTRRSGASVLASLGGASSSPSRGLLSSLIRPHHDCKAPRSLSRVLRRMPPGPALAHAVAEGRERASPKRRRRGRSCERVGQCAAQKGRVGGIKQRLQRHRLPAVAIAGAVCKVLRNHGADHPLKGSRGGLESRGGS